MRTDAARSLTIADTRPLDARGHHGEVDEMAQGPCTLAFKASQSFTIPEFKCIPHVIKDSIHANRSTRMT